MLWLLMILTLYPAIYNMMVGRVKAKDIAHVIAHMKYILHVQVNYHHQFILRVYSQLSRANIMIKMIHLNDMLLSCYMIRKQVLSH